MLSIEKLINFASELFTDHQTQLVHVFKLTTFIYLKQKIVYACMVNL